LADQTKIKNKKKAFINNLPITCGFITFSFPNQDPRQEPKLWTKHLPQTLWLTLTQIF